MKVETIETSSGQIVATATEVAAARLKRIDNDLTELGKLPQDVFLEIFSDPLIETTTPGGQKINLKAVPGAFRLLDGGLAVDTLDFDRLLPNKWGLSVNADLLSRNSAK